MNSSTQKRGVSVEQHTHNAELITSGYLGPLGRRSRDQGDKIKDSGFFTVKGTLGRDKLTSGIEEKHS